MDKVNTPESFERPERFKWIDDETLRVQDKKLSITGVYTYVHMGNTSCRFTSTVSLSLSFSLFLSLSLSFSLFLSLASRSPHARGGGIDTQLSTHFHPFCVS